MVTFPLDVEHSVIFISCCYQKGLGPQTVTTYISVSKNAFSNVRNQTFEVSRIIQEFQKLKQSVDVCTLITLSILQKWVYVPLLYTKNVCLFRFLLDSHAFLCIGKITCTDKLSAILPLLAIQFEDNFENDDNGS